MACLGTCLCQCARTAIRAVIRLVSPPGPRPLRRAAVAVAAAATPLLRRGCSTGQRPMCSQAGLWIGAASHAEASAKPTAPCKRKQLSYGSRWAVSAVACCQVTPTVVTKSCCSMPDLENPDPLAAEHSASISNGIETDSTQRQEQWL